MNRIAAKITGTEGDPCCCHPPCNVIAYSLCSDESVSPCFYTEFTNPEADPPIVASCPPKFYRTKTFQGTSQYTYNLSTTENEGPTETYHYQNKQATYEKVTTLNDGCEEEVECSGSLSSVDWQHGINYLGFPYGPAEEPASVVTWIGKDPYDNGCYCSETYEDPEFGTTTYYYYCSAFVGDSAVSFPVDNAVFVEDLSAIPSLETLGYSITNKEVTKTSITLTWERNRSGGPAPGYTGGWTSTETNIFTITLSDEVPFEDQLSYMVCDEISCDPSEDPNCTPCCTDETPPGLKFGDTPEGCIVPGDSSMAFYTGAPCDGSNLISGQSSTLSLWFKDLAVGEHYKITLNFLRCEFAKNEEGEYLVPTCSTPVPCKEGVDPEPLPPVEIVFEAEYWGEILSDRCGDCDIQYVKCVLDDAAAEWNGVNSVGNYRYTHCTDFKIEVPVKENHYTWLSSCNLERVLPG